MKPLLAATLTDLEHLPRQPLCVSAKLDGIRALIVNGEVMSRNMKPIRNKFIQEQLRGLPDGLDGELIVGSPNAKNVFNRTSSGVMSADGSPDFKFWVFDTWAYDVPFIQRYRVLQDVKHPRVDILQQKSVYSLFEIEDYERVTVSNGYEGIMIRQPHAPYKQGRSTHNEGILWKFKRFRDGEVIITGIEEGIHNMNEASRNELGELTRSSHKAGLTPSSMVGRLFGEDVVTGEQVVLSPGRMTHDERTRVFKNPELAIGRVATYKAFDYGKVDVPRFITFQGWRGDLA
jgi:DNA ligase-1